MAVEPLRDDLKKAGMVFVGTLDQLGLGVQGAAWLYFHGLGDWRFYVATPLTDTLGRRRVYSLLADALDVIGTPDGMTVFDLHLESPDGPLFKLLSRCVKIEGNSQVEFVECYFNDVRVDGVFYRVNAEAAAPALKYPKKAAREFERKVGKILERA